MEYLEKLRRLRINRDLRQEDVAEHLGVSRVAYTQYEGGKRKMDIDTFVKLCRFYSVTPNEILGFDESP